MLTRCGLKMDRQEQFRKNNELLALFMQQLLEDPELADNIPDDAEIIFLYKSDPELYQANLTLGKELRAQGRKVVFVQIELVPQVKTVFVPRLTLLQTV